MTSEERLDARIANEQLKLFANLLNALAGGAILAGIVTPILVTKQLDPWFNGFSFGGAVVLHVLGHIVLYDLKPEE